MVRQFLKNTKSTLNNRLTITALQKHMNLRNALAVSFLVFITIEVLNAILIKQI